MVGGVHCGRDSFGLFVGSLSSQTLCVTLSLGGLVTLGFHGPKGDWTLS